jgi:hypothetical protein
VAGGIGCLSKMRNGDNEMQKQTIIILTSLMFLYCNEGPDSIYINEKCNESEVEMIETAIEKANEYFDTDIVISGIGNGNYMVDDNINEIHCIHDPEDNFDVHGGMTAAGYQIGGDIIIYSHEIDNDHDWLHVIMHELGHYCGLEDDYENETEMMYYCVNEYSPVEY